MKKIDELPLVSVLVPVFNVERYVKEALESIAAQSHTNLQVIVVDDASTDRTAEIVRNFCYSDPRFHFFQNEKNQRIVKTLNIALDHAAGQYYARCDGDDVMEPDRISRQLEYLNRTGVDLVGCSLNFIDEIGANIGMKEYPSGSDLIRLLLSFCSPVGHVWLARRQVYELVGPYRIPSVEDYDFLLRANLAGFKLDNVPRYFGMKMRVRTGNTVSRYGVIQRKLFNYARRINQVANDDMKEQYSEDTVNALIEHGGRGTLAKLHYLSDRVSFIAGMKGGGVAKFILIVLAACLSPYKLQYYINALRSWTIVRASIQRTHASTATLSQGLWINPKTVAKWRKRL